MNRPDSVLRRVRKTKGLSQEDLEARTGVFQETISKFETRGPAKPVLNALRIARALGTTVEELFGSYVEQGAAKQPKPRSNRAA